MDPLSDVLSLLRPHNYLSSGMLAEGAWCLQFPHQGEGIKCGAVVSGQCWLTLDGGLGEVLLQAGDAFLLPSGAAFRLSSDRAAPPTDGALVFQRPGQVPGRGAVLCHRGTPAPELPALSLVSSRFALAGRHAHLLLRMLPPIVHLREEGEGDLRWAMERMMREMRAPQPGGSLIVEHLAHLVLVQALRQHMRAAAPTPVGWLFALTDPQIGAAMTALHADPARAWTLGMLATAVGMSRSSFAKKFKETVGSAPMDYLIRWRMLVAGDRLAQSIEPVSSIALSLGYASESAFSAAFKRVMGCPPRAYARGGAAAGELAEPLRRAS